MQLRFAINDIPKTPILYKDIGNRNMYLSKCNLSKYVKQLVKMIWQRTTLSQGDQ